MTNELRDLIYFDFDKATSIFSQIEGGLLRETQETIEGAKERRKGIGLDLKILKPEIAGVTHERTSVLESKVLHHDLLARLEQTLQDMDLLLDVNKAVAERGLDYSDQSLHNLISKPAFIVAEGWPIIEDYNRFSFIAANFKELVGFIQKAVVQDIKDSPEYKSVQDDIAEQKQLLKREKNSSRKRQMTQQIKELERETEKQIEAATSIEDLPDWMIEGIDLFIRTFMPNRINLRIYPFRQNSNFHVLSNLKRDSFVDSDLENAIFAYGTRPNVPLSVLGMITSIPSEEENSFDPVSLLEGSDRDEQQFEVGLRQAFRAFEEFESFVRFSHYPNITVYPIAVYQRLGKVIHEDAGTVSGDEREWLRSAASNPAFDFLKDSEEDIYTLDDGRPFGDKG